MKKKLVFVFIFVLTFFNIDFIYAYDIKTKPSGGNVNLCNSCCTDTKKTNCIKNCSKWCNNGINNDDVVTWTSTDNVTLFCLDKGYHMSYNTELTLKTNDTQTSNFACRVKKLYEASYTSISFADFVARLNDGASSIANKGTFMAMQDKIWDSNFTNDCGTDLTVYNYTKKNENVKIGIVNNGTTISGNYYIIHITVNLSSVTSYTINLSGEPNGSFVSTSKNGSSVSSASANKLYVHIPKNSNNISNDFTLQLTGGKYIKNSGTKYTPTVTIYQTGKSDWQRLGKVGYNQESFTNYGDDAHSNELSLTINACQLELDIINQNYTKGSEEYKQSLIQLYKNMKDRDEGNFNNLLNFDNPSCTQKTSCTYHENKNECLSVAGGLYMSKGTDTYCSTYDLNCWNNEEHTVHDLSCYNDTITIDNKTFYCITHLNFDDAYTNGYNSIENPFSGQFYLTATLMSQPSFSARLFKHCYIYGVEESKIVNAFKNENYNNYVSNISLYNPETKEEYELEKLDNFTNSDGVITSFQMINPYNISKNSTLHPGIYYQGTYRFESLVYYKLPSIYLEKGSGKVSSEQCDNCINAGNGLITKFTYTGNVSLKFVYELKTTNELLKIEHKPENGNNSDRVITLHGNTEQTKYPTCEFEAKQQLITTTTGGDKLQLEFRIIDTDNPFPGKLGGFRTKVGSNWRSTSDSSGDPSKNEIILDEAVNRNDSYNKTKAGAKYTITLTPSDIQTIRKYNKKTSYDDYTLYCDENGENCSSRFLDGLESGTLEFYNTKTNKVDGSWTIQNRLQINPTINLN